MKNEKNNLFSFQYVRESQIIEENVREKYIVFDRKCMQRQTDTHVNIPIHVRVMLEVAKIKIEKYKVKKWKKNKIENKKLK